MPHRFLVDLNVGRLVVWLRVLGYDTILTSRRDDRCIARQAMDEGRVLLTRDARLVRRRVVTSGALRALLLRSDQLWAQLQQVVTELQLDVTDSFTRCPRCNLALQPATREQVQYRLPPHVLQTQTTFRGCPGCNRVYWKGTHWRNMRAQLAQIIGRSP